jgi:hypothetical protein
MNGHAATEAPSPWAFSVTMMSHEETEVDLRESVGDVGMFDDLEDLFRSEEAPVRHWITTVAYMWSEAQRPQDAMAFASRGIDYMMARGRKSEAVPLLCQLVAYNVALARSSYKFVLSTASALCLRSIGRRLIVPSR